MNIVRSPANPPTDTKDKNELTLATENVSVDYRFKWFQANQLSISFDAVRCMSSAMILSLEKCISQFVHLVHVFHGMSVSLTAHASHFM